MSETFDLSGTSPATASTAVLASASGMGNHLAVRVDALLVGATGGALDVYIQRKVAPDLWVDWLHFPQLAAGASAIVYSATVQAGNLGSVVNNTPSATLAAITTRGTDSTPSPGLAAGTIDLNHPGNQIRVVCVAGASTSAGAALRITVTGLGPSR